MIRTTTRTPVVSTKKEYPKLMWFEGYAGHPPSGLYIVLMYKEGHGVVVMSENDKVDVGYHSVGWNMNVFSDYAGELVLTNE